MRFLIDKLNACAYQVLFMMLVLLVVIVGCAAAFRAVAP